MVSLAALVVVALIFEYSAGYNDSGSIVATTVYTGALDPGRALLLSAVFECVGALFLGTAVALTVATGIFDPVRLDIPVVWSALIAALSWNVFAGLRGIPTSSTHALIGGFMGAILVSAGSGAVNWVRITEVLAALLISPFAGIGIGFLLTKGAFALFGARPPGTVRRLFRRFQIVSSSALALAHGTNDAQKTMGVLTLLLMIAYREHGDAISRFYHGGDPYVPLWVRVACAAAVSLGVLTGGFRIMRTLGGRIYRVRSEHGFSAQAGSAAVVYGSAIFGFPVSTAQVVSSSIVGAGTAQRINAVRWDLVGKIISTWVITIPATAFLGGALYLIIEAADGIL
jgi:PiT family inorganic phosphate transporter